MQKAQLRSIFTQKRAALTQHEVATKSEAIAQHFFENYFSGNSVPASVHCFLPIQQNNEIDTWLIIKKIQNLFPSAKIVVPRVIPQTAVLNHYILTPQTTLITNRWGIPEPTEDSVNIEAQAYDLAMVLVPLLAFDKQGHRVGYGKGFYDRFLSQCGLNTLRVGLSLFEPIDYIEDINVHDVALGACITPDSVWSFKE